MKALRSRIRFANAAAVIGVLATYLACGGRSALDDEIDVATSGPDAEVSDAASLDASADAANRDACRDACSVGRTECRGGLVSACVIQTSGCADWATGSACEANATCEDDASGAACVCNAGYMLNAGKCTRDVIAHLRPVAPLSTATVTSSHPTFHWALGAGEDGAEIDICFDRSCSKPLTSFFGNGTSKSPSLGLAPGTYFWRVRGMTAGVVGKDISVVWEVIVGVENAPIDTSWGSIVDIDGDGFADVASTAWSTDSAATVGIYLGSASGTATTPIAVATSTPGVAPERKVTSAGDVNGDGYSDLLVFANGIAETYFGGPNWASTLPTSLALPPVVATNQFAYAAAGADDVNGDGYADVVIGSPNFSNVGKGLLYIYWGSDSGLTSTPLILNNASYAYGDAAAGIGDINGDGFADVATAANPGLYVFLGGANGPANSPVILGTSTGGVSLANGVDVNGDGYADIAIGEPNGLNQGDVDIYLGGPSGDAPQSIYISATPGLPGIFGYSIANAGDVNADGFGDIVVGTSGIIGADGAAAVYLGNASGIDTTPVSLTSPNRGGLFGWSVAGTGDTNGDGYGDVVIGGGGACTSLYLGGAAGTSSTAVTTTVTEVDGFSVR